MTSTLTRSIFTVIMVYSYVIWRNCDLQDVERMILGNKCDMEDKRVVSKERGEAIAREHNIRFLETSAKVTFLLDRAIYFTQKSEFDPPHHFFRLNSSHGVKN